MPYVRGQVRGKSGMDLQGRYECQILDSFGLGDVQECLGNHQVGHWPLTGTGQVAYWRQT